MNTVGNAATEPIFTNRLHVRRPVLSLSQRALSSTRTQIVVIDSREDIVPIWVNREDKRTTIDLRLEWLSCKSAKEMEHRRAAQPVPIDKP